MSGPVTRWIAGVIDCALNRIAPLGDHAHAYLAMSDHRATDGADRLADAEANTEVWEPAEDDCRPLEPWEQELRDIYLADKFPNADYHTVVDTSGATAAPKQPAGAEVSPPASATGAGGFPHNAAVATVIAVVLRGQGIQSAAIYADLIARELSHHFHITQK